MSICLAVMGSSLVSVLVQYLLVCLPLHVVHRNALIHSEGLGGVLWKRDVHLIL